MPPVTAMSRPSETLPDVIVLQPKSPVVDQVRADEDVLHEVNPEPNSFDEEE